MRKNNDPYEILFYELKPYLCLGLAVYGIFASTNSFLIGSSSILLITCSGLILQARAKYRSTHK